MREDALCWLIADYPTAGAVNFFAEVILKIIRFIPLLAVITIAPLAQASEYESCLNVAVTQADMSGCADMGYQEADAELNRVYNEIRKIYSDDKLFLDKLKSAQRAWITSRDADLALEYPHMDEEGYYGSVLPMCTLDSRASLTLERVTYLKRWLDGAEEGDVCSGSIMLQSDVIERQGLQ